MATPTPFHLWHTLSLAMQELPHGLPLTQFGFLVSAASPLRQELINYLRASPLMPLACELQSFILCCYELSWALAGIANAAIIATAIRYVLIDFLPRLGEV